MPLPSKERVEAGAVALFGENHFFWNDAGDEFTELYQRNLPALNAAIEQAFSALADNDMARWAGALHTLAGHPLSAVQAAHLLFNTMFKRLSLPHVVQGRLAEAAAVACQSPIWDARRYGFGALLHSPHPHARQAAVDFMKTAREPDRSMWTPQLLEARFLSSAETRALGAIALEFFKRFTPGRAVEWVIRDLAHRASDMASHDPQPVLIAMARGDNNVVDTILRTLEYHNRPERKAILRRGLVGISDQGLIELATEQPLNGFDQVVLDNNAAEMLKDGLLTRYAPPRAALEAAIDGIVGDLKVDLNNVALAALPSIRSLGELVDLLQYSSQPADAFAHVAANFWDPAVYQAALVQLRAADQGNEPTLS